MNRLLAAWPSAAFALGAALATSFLSSLWGRSTTGYLVVIAVGLVCTVLWNGSRLRNHDGPLRWVGWLCLAATAGLYGLWLFLAVAFGAMLGWTVPTWAGALLAASALWVLASRYLTQSQRRLPMVVPLGIWIAACLSGWIREEAVIRCDDLLSLDSPLELVVPSRPDLRDCKPGESKPAGRYPRTIWQDADGDRIVFTTQGEPASGGLDGSICEASLSGDGNVRCVGPAQGKSHGLIEIPEIDRLVAIQYALPTPSGVRGGVVFELPLSSRIEILDTHWFDDNVAQGFYEPSNKTMFMFTDSMRRVYRVSIPTFEPLPPLPVSGVCPSELHYDIDQSVGLSCQGIAGAALYGDPFEVRYFAHTPQTLWDRIPSATWGCNWDPTTKKVFTTLPNLGMLARIDFDTGRIEKRWPVGFGMRSVEYDPDRRRVYVTDFLRGRVLAFDEKSERVMARWSVGRFARWVRLTPDRRSLLVTSNLGVVRIPL